MREASLTVIRMQDRYPVSERTAEPAWTQSVHLFEPTVPRRGAQGHVPSPRAEPRGFDRQRETLLGQPRRNSNQPVPRSPNPDPKRELPRGPSIADHPNGWLHARVRVVRSRFG